MVTTHMGLFGNRQQPADAALEARVHTLERELLKLRAEVNSAVADASEAATRAYRFMKAAEQRERRALDPKEAAPGASAPESAPLAPFGGHITPARARRLMRIARPDPATELANGTHP